MSLKVLKTEEILRVLKLLIYGPQGVGKTEWVATNCPKPAAWVDFERSSDTILSKKIEGVDIIPVTPGDDPADVEAFCKRIDKSDYKTLAFDTISTSQVFQLQHWMTHGKPSKSEKESDLPGYASFRRSTNVFSRIFMELQHSNVNVVLLAHEREIWEGEGEFRRKTAIVPSVTPALHEAVTQLVSGVFRLSKKEGNRGAAPVWSMLCNSKGLYIAKNRYGIIEQEIESPTWDTFMKGFGNVGP